ncbi:MAG TPA: HTH domain-containing protein [Crenotrichaceae bacterium]|nr:HTH domain-containing protein [Crenotrichaceae bacterium]
MGIVGFGDKQQKILHFLVQEKEGMTVDQFSRRLEISRSAIHQHITVLERDGYVRKYASLQTGGRPGTTFVLTDKGIHLFPKHYSLFAEMLINLIKNKLGSKGLVDYLRELGVSLSETKKAALANKPLNKKIEMTVEIMQELGYDARVAESEPDQPPMIDAYNCVFHDLANENEEVCELDLSLLTSLLDSKIEHVCCMAKGNNQCRFKVLPADTD